MPTALGSPGSSATAAATPAAATALGTTAKWGRRSGRTRTIATRYMSGSTHSVIVVASAPPFAPRLGASVIVATAAITIAARLVRISARCCRSASSAKPQVATRKVPMSESCLDPQHRHRGAELVAGDHIDGERGDDDDSSATPTPHRIETSNSFWSA